MTHSRSGIACAIALLCVIGFSLPAMVESAAGASRDVPVDDRYRQQWSLDNWGKTMPLYPDAIADSDIDAPEAWEIMEGQGVTVAVVDQLVHGDHPDLAGNVEAGQDFTAPDGCTSGDPNGADDHGTMVAGLIAAQRDDGGIVGVAPLAHVKPLRAIDNCGGGKEDWILAAFNYAGEHEIPIVSASFASDPLAGPDAKLNQDFLTVFDRYPNTLFVVAAGNEGNDNDDPAHPVYPCSTKRPGPNPDVANLICVGMTDTRDEPPCWGNVGHTTVDLFAPGISILSSTRPGLGPWSYGNGTSMAAPLVAGAAAVVLSAEPQLLAAQLAERLVDGVDRKEALEPFSVAGGRLNAARSVIGTPRRLGSGGGESVPWSSCDRDHDGVRDDPPLDRCPDIPGDFHGCPDKDSDGVFDSSDNCPDTANAGQADSDGDGVGDACDQTPRGDDGDGDGVPALDDQCPQQAGVAPGGCPNPDVIDPHGTPPAATPTPAPTPAPPVPELTIVSLKAKLTPSRCPKSAPKCARVAKVTIKLSRQAKVALKVEQRVRSRGRQIWKRLSVRSLTASAKGSTVTVRGKRGKRSTYRVTATVANKKPKAVNFTV